MSTSEALFTEKSIGIQVVSKGKGIGAIIGITEVGSLNVVFAGDSEKEWYYDMDGALRGFEDSPEKNIKPVGESNV